MTNRRKRCLCSDATGERKPQFSTTIEIIRSILAVSAKVKAHHFHMSSFNLSAGLHKVLMKHIAIGGSNKNDLPTKLIFQDLTPIE